MVVDLDAIAANTAVLRERVGRPLMAVVKADGYGHGLVPAARAVAGRRRRLRSGVAVLEEALALRAAGVTAPLLAWLHAPGEDYAAALAADVEVSVNAEWALAEVVAAARATGRTARRAPVRRHRAVPRGRHPGGLAGAGRRRGPGAGRRRGRGRRAVEPPGLRRRPHPPDDRRRRCGCSRRRSALARGAGLTEARRHLANSAATIALPETWYDLVRPGVALYGLDPLGGDPRRLRPAPGDDRAGAGSR